MELGGEKTGSFFQVDVHNDWEFKWKNATATTEEFQAYMDENVPLQESNLFTNRFKRSLDVKLKYTGGGFMMLCTSRPSLTVIFH